MADGPPYPFDDAHRIEVTAPVPVVGDRGRIERRVIDGIDLIVHYDDLPPSDVTTVAGVPVTTPLRTMIDLAPEVSSEELAVMVRSCLDRSLFSLDEAWERLARPDMADRPGATLLRRLLFGR